MFNWSPAYACKILAIRTSIEQVTTPVRTQETTMVNKEYHIEPADGELVAKWRWPCSVCSPSNPCHHIVHTSPVPPGASSWSCQSRCSTFCSGLNSWCFQHKIDKLTWSQSNIPPCVPSIVASPGPAPAAPAAPGAARTGTRSRWSHRSFVGSWWLRRTWRSTGRGRSTGWGP